MTLEQLRFFAAVCESDLNITVAARRLQISQPGVSRQLKELEDELGLQLFERHGRSLIRITPAGAEILERAMRILREVKNITRASAAVCDASQGTLSLGTTHTQARYVLPEVIRSFRSKHPNVRLHLHQGTSEQIAQMIERDQVDFAIVTGSEDLFPSLIRLPIYRWHHAVIAPRGHPLATTDQLTLEHLAGHPVVTYAFSLSGSSSFLALFETAGLSLNISLTARDSDVLKTYVRAGLGIGIVASVAIDPTLDADLSVLNAEHLFDGHTAWLGFRRGSLLTGYMYEFIQQLAPHVSLEIIQHSEVVQNQEELERILQGIRVPRRDRGGLLEASPHRGSASRRARAPAERT
jgi:LysR family cys regulon transcriptional activator